MIQIAVVAVSIGLIVIGIKGFTKSGLKLSKQTTLSGMPAKIVGAVCILLGLAFIPLFMLFFLGYSSWLGR